MYLKSIIMLSKIFEFVDFPDEDKYYFTLDDKFIEDKDVLGRLRLERLVNKVKTIKDFPDEYINNIYECIKSNIDINNFSIDDLKDVRILNSFCTDSNIFWNVEVMLYTCFNNKNVNIYTGIKCESCKWYVVINIADEYVGVKITDNRKLDMINLY